MPPITTQDEQISASPPPSVPDHELFRCIGSGGYGEVWLARNVMGTYRAVKVVYRHTFSDPRPYEREFGGMQKFEPVSRSHDGLIDILQVGRNDSAGYFYYVMELADDFSFGQDITPQTYRAKTLGQLLVDGGKLDFEQCVALGVSLAAALDHLHQHGLIHRDIKPSNIIFVNGIPKIADIGLVTEAGLSHSIVGTEGFMPPEGPGSVQADIYSLGKVLYEASTGHDRKEFPELPTDLAEAPAAESFMELNEVVLRACDATLRKRYPTAKQMHADLVFLQAGKSVKRLRLLEKRLLFLKKIAFAAALALLIGGALLYQHSRELKAAAEKKEFADKLRQQEAEQKQLTVGLNVAHGTRAVDQGDYFGSLPSFVKALILDQDNPLARETQRLRIGSVLQRCPRLIEMCVLENQINNAQLSRDGRYLIAAGVNGSALLWEIKRDSTPAILASGPAELEDASFSADGQRALTSSDQGADLWELPSMRRLFSFKAPGTIYSAKLSPDRTKLLTASRSETGGFVWLWDATTGAKLSEIATNRAGFRYASFSPNGQRIVTAGEDNLAQLWDLASGKPVGEPIRHDGWVFCANFSPDGSKIVTASYDRTSLVCDAQTGRPILPPLKHEAGVKSASFSPDGQFIVTACWDFTARVWTAHGEPINPALKHSGKHVVYASFFPDGRRVLTANANGVICLWDLAPTGLHPLEQRLAFSHDGQFHAAFHSNTAQLFLASDQQPVAKITTDLPIKQLELNRNGARLLVISRNSPDSPQSRLFAQLYKVSDSQPLSPSIPLPPHCTGAILSPDGSRLAARAGTNIFIWTLPDVQIHFTLNHPADVKGMAFSPNAKFLVTVSGDKDSPDQPLPWELRGWHSKITGTNAHLWDLSTGKQIHLLKHQFPVSYAEFSPDNLRLVTCTSDLTLFERAAQIWDVQTGAPVGPPLQHGDGVLSASFSPDGKRIVTASEDTTARVWDARTGKPLITLQHSANAKVADARFSPDGRWIATASEEDQTARLWDAATGEPLTPPLKQPEPFKQVQFVNGARDLLTKRSTGETMLWRLTSDRHRIEDLARLAELLSGTLPQSREALRESWQKLRAENPADFSVSESEIIAWHLQQAQSSETDQQWNAALFHWQRLTEIQPANPLFQQQRNQASQKLVSN